MRNAESNTELLDELLVLVESLERLNVTKVNAVLLGLITVDLVTKNADLQARLARIRETESARETLVALGVVVLKTDLQLNSLDEATLLGLGGVLEHLTDGLAKSGLIKLAASGIILG